MSRTLAGLRRREATRMAGGPLGDMFRLLTSGPVQDVADLPRAGQEMRLGARGSLRDLAIVGRRTARIPAFAMAANDVDGPIRLTTRSGEFRGIASIFMAPRGQFPLHRPPLFPMFRRLGPRGTTP